MSVILLFAAALGGGKSIDSIVAAEWNQRGIKPANACSDQQFLRRVTLDLVGRIPTVEELHDFLQNPDRAQKVDQLLASDDFPRFWSEVWTAVFHGYTSAFGSDREVMRLWLEDSLKNDVSYDRMATALIAARGRSALDGPVNFLVRHPEEPAVKVARLFLGVRLDCARCHDHPFDRWTQEDFHRVNRFFEATERREVSEGNIRLFDRRPEVPEEERPRFLTGARPQTTQWRSELALFITNCKPFARAYANRLWYHFMGRGIVDPVDDFNRENPPSIPPLMQFLMEQARADGFALKPMIRRICNSKVYQLSSQTLQRSPEQEAVFAYHKLKPLTPEQSYDSIATALQLEDRPGQRQRFIRQAVGESLDEDFSHTWEDRQTVQQLMTTLSRGIPMRADSVDRLYLRILARKPTPKERKLCEGQQPETIAFALLNSNEFYFNH